MAAPKAKTLQQKLGFFDDDLKIPQHDEIIKWVELNIKKILYALHPEYRTWDEKSVEQHKAVADKAVKNTLRWINQVAPELEGDIERYLGYALAGEKELPTLEMQLGKDSYRYTEAERNAKGYKATASEKQLELARIKELHAKLIKWTGLGEVPERIELRIEKCTWEYPVTAQSKNSYSGYQSSKNIVGFVDLEVIYYVPTLGVKGLEFNEEKVIQPPEWGQFRGNEHHLFVEVKTKLPTLGELYRQLKMYQEYVAGEFLIVCPDDSEKEHIKQQGFSFYKYEAE